MTESAQTAMSLSVGEDWDVIPDMKYDYDAGTWGFSRVVPAHGTGFAPTARLRRVGWLDQKGRVWTETPPMAQFDGGSLTPLLIDAREDGS
jgi:hypothetical protein